jgi:hypothetical protein
VITAVFLLDHESRLLNRSQLTVWKSFNVLLLGDARHAGDIRTAGVNLGLLGCFGLIRLLYDFLQNCLALVLNLDSRSIDGLLGLYGELTTLLIVDIDHG